MNLFVTGGCGFIGSNFVRHVLSTRVDVRVVVFDALTYAGNLENLADVLGSDRLTFVRGDIADRAAVLKAASGCSVLVNFAAESHVDRSIHDASPFIRTNVQGTQVLLESALELGFERFLQMSTDEVYGSLGPSGKFTEDTPLAPNSPYSASKASSDLLVRAAVQTHGTPALILRSSNAYGPYQFPEKLIPLMITRARAGETLPVYGDGLHTRDWIHVSDLAAATLSVLDKGEVGEVYNVGGGHEAQNIDVVRRILALTGGSESQVRFVEDRPGHDRRYAMDFGKIQKALGWEPQHDFEVALAETVDWYVDNGEWLDSVRTGEYERFYERQYSSRLEGY